MRGSPKSRGGVVQQLQKKKERIKKPIWVFSERGEISERVLV